MDASETRCPFCGEQVAWEKKSAAREPEASGPVGRGGWLIPVAIYLFLSLAEIGFLFLGYFISQNRLISGLCGLYVLYDIILIVLYFVRHRYFRTTALFVQALHIACLAAITADGMIADPSTMYDTLTIGVFLALIAAGVMVYLFRSRRVKNTYRDVRPDA